MSLVCAMAEHFRRALTELLTSAKDLCFAAVDVNAGNLHRRVSGYPGNDHRMPQCCEAMRRETGATDELISEPLSGQGASLTIRYRLPRQLGNFRLSEKSKRLFIELPVND